MSSLQDLNSFCATFYHISSLRDFNYKYKISKASPVRDDMLVETNPKTCIKIPLGMTYRFPSSLTFILGLFILKLTTIVFFTSNFYNVPIKLIVQICLQVCKFLVEFQGLKFLSQ